MAHLFDNQLQLQRRVNGARGIVMPFDVESLHRQRQTLAIMRNDAANKRLNSARKIGYQKAKPSFLANLRTFIKAFIAA
jgi:hypothetical protein